MNRDLPNDIDISSTKANCRGASTQTCHVPYIMRHAPFVSNNRMFAQSEKPLNDEVTEAFILHVQSVENEHNPMSNVSARLCWTRDDGDVSANGQRHMTDAEQRIDDHCGETRWHNSYPTIFLKSNTSESVVQDTTCSSPLLEVINTKAIQLYHSIDRPIYQQSFSKCQTTACIWPLPIDHAKHSTLSTYRDSFVRDPGVNQLTSCGASQPLYSEIASSIHDSCVPSLNRQANHHYADTVTATSDTPAPASSLTSQCEQFVHSSDNCRRLHQSVEDCVSRTKLSSAGGAPSCPISATLEIGACFSCCAYMFDSDCAHRTHWVTHRDNSRLVVHVPTVLLMCADHSLLAFGFEAQRRYLQMDAATRGRHIYLSDIQLAVFSNTSLYAESTVVSHCGHCVRALHVYTLCLRYLARCLLAHIPQVSPAHRGVTHAQVLWVLCLPSYADLQLKRFIRLAAYRAGLCPDETAHNILIPTDTEAVAVHCLSMLTRDPVIHTREVTSSTSCSLAAEVWRKFNHRLSRYNSLPKRFKTGRRSCRSDDDWADQTFTVVNCSESSCCVATYQIITGQPSPGLKEVCRCTTALLEEADPRKQFTQCLENELGDRYWAYFQQIYPADFIRVCSAFETCLAGFDSKHSDGRNRRNRLFVVKFGRNFKHFCLENAIYAKTSKSNSRPLFNLSKHQLEMGCSQLSRIYTPACDKIHKIVQTHLDHLRYKQKYCTVFFTGSLFKYPQMSSLLISRLASQFSSFKFTTVEDCDMVGVRGSLLHSFNPSAVRVRCCPRTYGLGVVRPFIPGLHTLDKFRSCDGRNWCVDVFDKFTHTAQPLAGNEMISRVYTPASRRQNTLVLGVYRADSDQANYITDSTVWRCGTLRLDLVPLSALTADGVQFQPRRIEVSMRFDADIGDIQVSAVDVTTGRSVKCQLSRHH